MLQNNYINNSYRKSEFCAFTISLSSFMYSKIKGTLNYSLCTMLGSQNPVQCSLDNLRFLLELFQGNHCVNHKMNVLVCTPRRLDFSNFSCMFLNTNYFFPIWILIVLMSEETSRNKLKSILFQKLGCPKIVLTFHCSKCE